MNRKFNQNSMDNEGISNSDGIWIKISLKSALSGFKL